VKGQKLLSLTQASDPARLENFETQHLKTKFVNRLYMIIQLVHSLSVQMRKSAERTIIIIIIIILSFI